MTIEPTPAAPDPDAPPGDAGRRGVLVGVSAAAGAAVVGSLGIAAAARPGASDTTAAPTTATPTTTTSPTSTSADPSPGPPPATREPGPPAGDADLARLRRACYGVTEADIETVRTAGWTAWLDAQLDAPAEDADLDELLAPLTTLTMTPVERRAALQADDGPSVDLEVAHAALVRATATRWQLREVLVGHWHDHFHTSLDVRGVVLGKADLDATIRRLALGDFAELLHAATASPPMLLALDNATSRAPDPNENHARELLELHTLGVDGGYSEDDVVDAARVLTGWSIDRRTGTFAFRPAWHDTGPKTVLGWSTPGLAGAAGEDEGRELLDHLASQIATARNVTRRLAQRLVADHPPDAVVDAGVAAWTATGGSMAAVVEALLSPAVFDAGAGAKVSRPFEALATMIRRLGGTVDVTAVAGSREGLAAPVLQAGLRQMGQPTFRAPAPTGYPNVAGAWTSSHAVATRWRIAAALCGRSSSLGIELGELSAGATTVSSVATALAERLWLRPPTDTELAALVTSTGEAAAGPITPASRAGLSALVLATGPGFER